MKFLTLLALVIQIPAFAAAQPRPTGAEEAAGRRAPTTLEDQSKEGKAAEAAARRRAVEGDRVTYQQVLADPDNIDLNNRFARTQIAPETSRGRAPERSSWWFGPQVRPLRLALFRLDNLNEAEREINALTGLTLPANLQAELIKRSQAPPQHPWT